MKAVRIPGILWVFMLMALGAVVQHFAPVIEAHTFLTPVEVDAIVAVLFGAYKWIDLDAGTTKVADEPGVRGSARAAVPQSGIQRHLSRFTTLLVG